jgi:uncharacterized protein with beta-barrel porin domain
MDFEMKREVSNGPVQGPFARHRLKMLGFALTLAPLTLAPFAIDTAEACTVGGFISHSASNSTVDCAGTTTNSAPNTLDGYGTHVDVGNTINVNVGATVTSTLGGGIFFGSGIVNNSGTISSTSLAGNGQAIGAGDLAVINNFAGATISSSASIAAAIDTAGLLNLTNAGLVQQTGNNGFGVTAHGDAVITNSNTISATAGTGIFVFGGLNLVGNTGTITGNKTGIQGNASATINNTNTISGTGAAGVGIFMTGSDATIDASGNTGTGTITGAAFGIKASPTANLTVSNGTGTISATNANGIAIGGAKNVTVTANAGNILAIAAGGTAIQALTGTVNVNGNTGSLAHITGDAFGINAATVNVTGNTGTIEALSGIAILATTTATVISSGTIRANAAGGEAINATTVNLTNSGTVQANGNNGFGIVAQTLNLNNSGTIEATGPTGVAIAGTTVNVTNSNIIRATLSGISATNANVTGNSGTIEATGPGGIAIFASNAANVTSSGAISGAIGIQANGAGGVGSVITNSGTIASTAGATGTAIKLSAANDTLTLKPTSKIVGLIDMGNGNDTINVETGGGAVARGLSSLSVSANAVVTALKAQLVNFDTTTGDILNVIVNTVTGAGQPTVTVGNQTASLDPTALAQQDRTLADFTGGVSSMVRARLNGVSSGGASLTMMSYALDDSGSSATGAFPKALGYAPENASAQMFGKAPAATWNAAPLTVWTSGFGGQRTQNETENTLRSTSTAFGGALGVDRKIRPDWLVGVFAGGGAGALSMDRSSQKVDTDYVFGGAYSRFEWANQFLDFTVQGGNARNKSTRLVQNNVAGGIETASASYNGWFVSPELAYGYRYDFGNGYRLTPNARVRYVAGLFDGYSESGSAQTLSVRSRTLQDVEERGEVDLSRTTSFFGGDHVLKTNVHGGVIALQRVGDTSVSTVLIGQNLVFATPGKGSTVGAVLGAGFDYHTSKNVALFGTLEGIAMSDQSRTATAVGGVRVAF